MNLVFKFIPINSLLGLVMTKDRILDAEPTIKNT